MYNKLFTKILDSSIWLAPDPHRLVWITLLAAMDEDGNAMFASAKNLAARARVSIEDAESAIKAFEQPDPDSGDPDNEGRRIERFPGGWFVLNAEKYRAIVTKAVARERTRERVARFREKKAGNANVTTGNARVTPSEADTEAISETKSQRRATRLPTDFLLTKEREEFARKEGLDPQRTFEGFRDYWNGVPGQKGCKLDWEGTWRNWCRREKPTQKQVASPVVKQDDRWPALRELASRKGFRMPVGKETAEEFEAALNKAASLGNLS